MHTYLDVIVYFFRFQVKAEHLMKFQPQQRCQKNQKPKANVLLLRYVCRININK